MKDLIKNPLLLGVVIALLLPAATAGGAEAYIMVTAGEETVAVDCREGGSRATSS